VTAILRPSLGGADLGTGIVRIPGMAILGSLALTSALVACATASAGPSSPLQVDKQLVSYAANGQWGKVYDAMHPAQQNVVAYGDFFRCVTQAVALGRAFGYDFSTARWEDGTVDPRKRSIRIPGTRLRVQATAVHDHVSVEAGGKRTTLASDEPTYFVRVRGSWRWIDTDTSPADYRKLHCGN
jgi:hypothetical protein